MASRIQSPTGHHLSNRSTTVASAKAVRMSLALVFTALVTASCHSNKAGQGFFPLAPGHAWTYRVVTEIDADDSQGIGFGGIGVANQTNTKAPSEKQVESQTIFTIEGIEFDQRESLRRQTELGTEYLFREDETGIYRVASKTMLDPEHVKDEVRRYVLKKPYAVGTSWQHSTTAFLLHRRVDFPREVKYSHPKIPMIFTIESMTESVKTEAGEWTNCIRVKGVAQVRLYADSVQGWKDLPLINQEWFCDGVGLVKLEREELASTSYVRGGKLSMELQSWR
jgi:hypothetical protein